MKILAIRIRNLASLEGNAEIDFQAEPLCSAGIFAITGPTGAGKSTLLDALCLALYARTPRYRSAENGIEVSDVQGSTIKQDDVRGILRDGTADGFAEVDFEGVDMQEYRARWSVRRARNKAEGNLQAYEMALKNLSAQTDVPGRKTELLEEIERLVGLNFEQFTRSVLLAQGDFTAFLKAGKDEKSSLLEKLTGTHIYSEISKRIFEHQREEQQKLKDLKQKIEDLTPLNDDQLAALNSERLALQQQIGQTDKLLSTLHQELTWTEQLELLQHEVDAAIQLQQSAMEQKQAAASRALQLRKIESVQSFRSNHDQLRQCQAEDRELQENLLTEKKQLERLAVQLDESNSALRQAETQLAQTIKEQEDATPLVAEANSLDLQLAERQLQIETLSSETQLAAQRLSSVADEKRQTQEALEVEEREMLRLGVWKKEHQGRAAIAENEILIKSKLEDATKVLRSLAEYKARISRLEEAGKQQEEQRRRLQMETDALNTSIMHLSAQISALQVEIDQIEPGRLETDKAGLEKTIEELVSAAAQWQLLYQAKATYHQLLQKSGQTDKEYHLLQVQLSEARNTLLLKKQHLESTTIAWDRAKLIAAENVEQLRAGLTEGIACPVCGSEQHPYASHSPLAQKVLADMEQQHSEATAAYSEQVALEGRLSEAIARTELLCAELKQNVSLQQKTLEDMELTWSRLAVHSAAEKIPESEREEWLQHYLLQHREKLSFLQQQLQVYAGKKADWEQARNQLVALERKAHLMQQQIKEAEHQMRLSAEQITNDGQEIDKSAAALEELSHALGIYFASDIWMQHWQKAPEHFVQKITDFASEWRNNHKLLEETEQSRAVLRERLKNIEDRYVHARADTQVKEKQLQEARQRYDQLLEQRRKIFAGVDAALVAEQLKNKVTLQQDVAARAREAFELLQTTKIKSAARVESLGQRQLAVAQQLREWQAKLEDQLRLFGEQYGAPLQPDELEQLLAYDDLWRAAEREYLQEVENALLRAASVLEGRRKALREHTERRLSERQKEELLQEQIILKERWKQQHEALNQIGFRINDDAEKRLKLGRILKEIERQAEVATEWARLSELIGSADGKKFRQLAQEYTLDVLLGYANVHLEALNKRYILQRVPHSLGLQVLDQDMGDEIRTVFSLSGGESFLVSLALALGLSALSSSRMKVASLFIDEGFGSLDPATLNIAMDALERLHSQGRKVGVISHVQEITERIPVQIRVCREQRGRSSVTVVGL
jgi:exonuclease SbcC